MPRSFTYALLRGAPEPGLATMQPNYHNVIIPIVAAPPRPIEYYCRLAWKDTA